MTLRDIQKQVLQVLKERNLDIYEGMRDILKYYDEVYLTFENGKFNYEVGFGIRAKYAPDYKAYLAYDKSFFTYTEEELEKAKEELSRCQWY